MICTNCSSEVPDTAKVCGYCGHRLKSVVTEAQKVPVLGPSETRAPAPDVWNEAPTSAVARSGPQVGPWPEEARRTPVEEPARGSTRQESGMKLPASPIPAVQAMHRRFTWFFVVLWTASYAIGYSRNVIVTLFISPLVGGVFFSLPWQVETVIVSIVGGFAVGLLQWLILRRHSVPLAWIPLTAVGLMLGDSLTYFIVMSFLLAAAISGAISGAAQWLILRRLMPRAYWWIIINSAAALATTWLALLRPLNDFAFQAVFGALTGIGMLWLFREVGVTPFTRAQDGS